MSPDFATIADFVSDLDADAEALVEMMRQRAPASRRLRNDPVANALNSAIRDLAASEGSSGGQEEENVAASESENQANTDVPMEVDQPGNTFYTS